MISKYCYFVFCQIISTQFFRKIYFNQNQIFNFLTNLDATEEGVLSSPKTKYLAPYLDFFELKSKLKIHITHLVLFALFRLI